MKTKEIYKAIIELYGEADQWNMVIEECAELIHAINKYRRNPTEEKLNSLCGEIADVEIMCEQARLMTGKHDLINLIKFAKKEKLKQRINENKRN